MNVLVVDDDQGFLDVMQSTLELHGVSVLLASSGYEAIALLQSNRVDLVVSDYRMQNGDGVSLSHYCDKKGVACVIFTGALPHVVKPYLPKGTAVIKKIDCFEPGRIFGVLGPHLIA